MTSPPPLPEIVQMPGNSPNPTLNSTAMAKVPIHFPTRHSAYTTKQPDIQFVDVCYADAPAMWAQENLAETAFSKETWAKRPKRISASTIMTPAPYTRSVRLTVESAAVADSDVQLAILSASENREDVRAAMAEDVKLAIEEAEERGWTVRQQWRDYKYGVYLPACYVSVSVEQTGKSTWWDYWAWNMDNQGAEREWSRIAAMEEEQKKEDLGEELSEELEKKRRDRMSPLRILGEELWKGEGEEKKEARKVLREGLWKGEEEEEKKLPTWEEMGLFRVKD